VASDIAGLTETAAEGIAADAIDTVLGYTLIPSSAGQAVVLLLLALVQGVAPVGALAMIVGHAVLSAVRADVVADIWHTVNRA
jgi:hypothetical protein